MNKKEFVDKYGSEVLQFTGYYKYTFNFEGTAADGSKILANLGGDREEIYRAYIYPEMSISKLNYEAPCVFYLNGKEVEGE